MSDEQIHFVDQEGGIWDMEEGRCPRCANKSIDHRRVPASGYFNCSDCNVVYDEPMFPCSALIGFIDEGAA